MPFEATLSSLDGTRVATGKDFDAAGRLTSKSRVVFDEETAGELASELRGSKFSVRSVEAKPYTRRPYPPFRTSTLQQEVGRKMRFSGPPRACRRHRSYTRAATSPTCAPTPSSFPLRRSRRRECSCRRSTGPSICRPSPGSTRARSRMLKRPTRPYGRQETRSRIRRTLPASSDRSPMRLVSMTSSGSALSPRRWPMFVGRASG